MVLPYWEESWETMPLFLELASCVGASEKKCSDPNTAFNEKNIATCESPCGVSLARFSDWAIPIA